MGRQKKFASNAETLGTQSTTTADISQASPAPVEDEPRPAAFVERGDPGRPAKRRVSFPVTEDGKVDWGTLRDKGKAELIEVVKADPELARLTGAGSLQEEYPFEFTDKDMALALSVLNSVNSFTTRFFFARFKGFQIDDDIAALAFAFQPEENCPGRSSKDCKCDEKVLSERGARIANKYSGEWLKRHAELVMFAGLYMKCVTQQTITAVVMQNAKNQQPRSPVRPNGHPAQPAQVQP